MSPQQKCKALSKLYLKDYLKEMIKCIWSKVCLAQRSKKMCIDKVYFSKSKLFLWRKYF